jgi:hypothetical protein
MGASLWQYDAFCGLWVDFEERGVFASLIPSPDLRKVPKYQFEKSNRWVKGICEYVFSNARTSQKL